MKCRVCHREYSSKPSLRTGVGDMCRYCTSVFKNKTYSKFIDYSARCIDKRKRILRDIKLSELGI